MPSRPRVTHNPVRPELLEPRRLMAAAPPLASAGDVDVAYDSTGTLHLAYYDASAHNLKYAARSTTGDWTDPVVIDAASVDVGAHVSIAVDAAGLPGVAYRDVTNADLKFARRDAAGAWAAQLVDGRGRVDAGLHPDLAFDGTGAPVISYYRPTGRALRLATLSLGRWKVRNLAGVRGPERAISSVATNPATGTYAVTYQGVDGAVRYASMVGRKFRTVFVDRLTRGAAGAGPSLGFNAAGVPGIAYYDPSRAQVKLAHPEGLGWAFFPIGSTNGQGTGPTLLVNRTTGAAEVVFRDPSSDNAVAAGPLTGSAFSVRDLNDGDDNTGAPPPAVAMDPLSRTIIAAYPGSNVGVQSSLLAAQGLTVSGQSVDSLTLSWADAAVDETGYEVYRSEDGGATFALVATLGANATSAGFNGLPEAKAYAFRVVTVDAVGNRATSATLSTSTLAVAPSNVTATIVSPTRVDVTWQDQSGGETAFAIQRRVGGGAWSDLVVVPPNSSHYPDTSAAGSTAYEYRVAAAVGSARNYAAATAAVTTPVAPPGSLTVTNATAKQVILTWTNVNGETGYLLERAAAGSTDFTLVDTIEADRTTFAHGNLPEDAVFVYRVRANSASGPSEPSPTAQVAVRLATPTSVTVTPHSSTSVTLNWADNSAAEVSYEVQWSLNSSSFTTVATVGEGVTTTNVALNGAGTYRFRVRAKGLNIESNFSSAVQHVAAAPGAAQAQAPAALSVVPLAGGTKMDLAWVDTNVGETAHQIERSANGGAFVEIATVTAGQTQYVDSGLAAGAVYRYRVYSRGPWGQTPYSNVATELADVRPTAVTATAVTQTSLDVAWVDNCPRETSYEVRYGDGVHSFTATAAAGATGATLEGLTPGANYTVTVVAVQDAQRQWAADPVTAVMLLAPADLVAGAGDEQGRNLSSAVTLTWSDVNTAEGGYTIERSEDGGATWAFLADAGADATAYTDRSVPENTTYHYRVYAHNLNGVGPAGDAATNTPATWLNAPSALTATAVGAGRIDLSWTDNSGSETGYVIAMSFDGDVFFDLAEVGNAISGYAVTADVHGAPLVAGTTYHFRVIARSATNASDYSGAAHATAV